MLAVEPDFCSRPLAWLHLQGPLQAAPVQVYECKDPCRPGTLKDSWLGRTVATTYRVAVDSVWKVYEWLTQSDPFEGGTIP